jgi:menaquinone-dependent protoporphyrinogen IX oxidase
MKNAVVIYKSKYGSTQKYAKWISERLDCDLLEASEVGKNSLLDYDTIIYGGGLYASGINGISLITKNYEVINKKNIIVFTVGLADPNVKEHFKPIIDKNFTDEMKDHIKVFHFRGAIDYKKLGFIHKTMMAMLAAMVKNRNESELDDEDKMMLETYGTNVDFTDKSSIEPLVTFVTKI